MLLKSSRTYGVADCATHPVYDDGTGSRRSRTILVAENGDYREVFATEIEKALEVLAVLPGIGTPYAAAGVQGVRRVYLRRIACHLYYVFDDDRVVIMALWGARRGRGPAIP